MGFKFTSISDDSDLNQILPNNSDLEGNYIIEVNISPRCSVIPIVKAGNSNVDMEPMIIDLPSFEVS